MGWKGLAELGLNGVVFGLFYSTHYLYSKRWILKFPIIQVSLYEHDSLIYIVTMKRIIILHLDIDTYGTANWS